MSKENQFRAVYQVICDEIKSFDRHFGGNWKKIDLKCGMYIFDFDIVAPNRIDWSFDAMLDKGLIKDVFQKNIFVLEKDIENVFYSEKDMVDISNKKMQSANKKGGKKKDDVEEVEDINQDVEEEVN